MASNFKLKNNNSTELNIQHVDNAPAISLTSTDLSKISGLGTSSLSSTQIKAGIEKANDIMSTSIDSIDDLLEYEGETNSERLINLITTQKKISLNVIVDISDVLIFNNVSEINISGTGGIKYTGTQSYLSLLTFNDSVGNVSLSDITIDGNDLIGGGISIRTNHILNGLTIKNIYMKYDSGNTGYAIRVSYFQNIKRYSKISYCDIFNIYSDNIGTISEAAGSAKGIYYAIDQSSSGSMIECSYNNIHDIYGREGDAVYSAGFDVDNVGDLEAISYNSFNNKTNYYIYNNHIYNVNRRCIKFHSSNAYIYNNRLSLYDIGDSKDINATSVISMAEYYTGARAYKGRIYNNYIYSNSNFSNQSLALGKVDNVEICNNEIIHINNIKGAITFNESNNIKILNNTATSGWFVALQGNATNIDVFNNKWTPKHKDHGMIPGSSLFAYNGLNVKNNELYIPSTLPYSQGIIQIKDNFNSFLNTKIVDNIVNSIGRLSVGYLIRNYGGKDTDADFLLKGNYTNGNLAVNPIDYHSNSYGVESKMIANINYRGEVIPYPNNLSVEMLTNSDLFIDSTGYTLSGGCTYDTTLKMIHLKEDLNPDLSSSIRQSISMVEGSKYILTFNVDRYKDVNFSVRVTSSINIASYTLSNIKIGLNTIIFTAPPGADRVYFVRNSTSATDLYINSFSLKKIL